tara:strand:- start:51 stop:347 length:297 start_codon:yes stop_codon:yes gene_type:complete
MKLKDLIKEELLKEFGFTGDLGEPVDKAEKLLDKFKDDLEYLAGGGFDSDSIEYEKDRWDNNSRMLKGRYKNLVKWEKNLESMLKKSMQEYIKAWKVK